MTRQGNLRPASSQPLLTGGRNFRLESDNRNPFDYYRNEYEQPRYVIMAGGYMEMRLDMQGSPSERGNYGALEVNIYEDKRGGMQITDAGQIAVVEGLTTSGSWIKLEFSSGTRDAMLPIDRLLQEDNTIHLRLGSIQDVQAELPKVTIR